MAIRPESNKIRFIFRAAQIVFKDHKGKFFSILVLGFLAGLSGGLGISAIIPIFSILTGQGTAETDRVTQVIEKLFSLFGLPFNVLFLVIFIACLFVVKSFIQFLARYINSKTAAEYEASLRNKIFNATFRSTWSYLINQKIGYLERIIMNDTFKSSTIILRVANLILLGTSLAMYAIVALSISARITFLTAGFGVLLFLACKPFFYRTKKVSETMAKTEKIVTHHVSESVLGAKVIKMTAVEGEIMKGNYKLFEDLKNARIKSAFYQYAVSNVFEPLAFIFIAILFAFYYRLPDFNIVSFGAVVYLVQKMFAYGQSLQSNAYELGEMIPYLQVIGDYRAITSQNKEEVKGTTSFDFQDKLEINNVEFTYNQDKKILSGVNFVIHRGEMVGLVGPSGSGKTTVADLILRLFYPTRGEILIDGKNATEINIANWRKNIGYVSQDTFLLNDTIENNIKFFDNSISNDDIIEAAKAANAYDFIQELKDDFQSIIGERGLRLSVGQRQRVVLARVLARKPKILILDEATSSLDNKSESLVQKAIENLKGKITVLAIAHRLSTIMNADKLLVLDDGRIIEEGLPSELLKDKDSHFYKIYNIDSGNAQDEK